MSKLREAAAMLIEQGRALGHLEQARMLVEAFTRSAAEHQAKGEADVAAALARLGDHYAVRISFLEQSATTAQQMAQQIIAELEHPGAVLGRRLLASARAARAAWRAR